MPARISNYTFTAGARTSDAARDAASLHDDPCVPHAPAIVAFERQPDGSLVHLSETETPSPFQLCTDPDAKFLYAVSMGPDNGL